MRPAGLTVAAAVSAVFAWTVPAPAAAYAGQPSSTAATPSGASSPGGLLSEVHDAVSQLQAVRNYSVASARLRSDTATLHEMQARSVALAQLQRSALQRLEVARAAEGAARDRLGALAIAEYTGASDGEIGPRSFSRAGQDGFVSAEIVAGKTVADYRSDVAQAKAAAKALDVAGRSAAAAAAEVSTWSETVRFDMSLAVTARQQAVTVSEDVNRIGPTVIGPAVLTAAELAGWYLSTGRSSAATVPIEQLAADYISAGAETGVRGDLAFAQAVVETAYFTFPAGGQDRPGQNNFAGIGACDSCATGMSFPDAATGVKAQEQLLEQYASPASVSRPLVAAGSPAGCCRTWAALASRWASNPGYGTEILSVYAQMLGWAVSHEGAQAGLEGPAALRPAPVGGGTHS